jgi:glycosyltransferase involved in cell wall biosynthesis
VYPALARAAAAEPAELFIGHYPAGLAAAAHAAARWRTRLGFDAEDLHAAEPPDTAAGRRQAQRIEWIERALLPRCTHRTAVSVGVAEALAARYAIPRPVAVHNAFPLAGLPGPPRPPLDRRGPELSLHWFSQVVGLDRGLQDAIRAAGCLGGPVQIHVRGTCLDSTRDALLRLAAASGVVSSLHFHPPVPPADLIARAAEHDVGLALEESVNESRALSVTNKLFAYLAAGLAVAATDLPGQRAVLETCPEAARLYTPGDHRALAACLEEWRRDPARLRAARAAALSAARTRWCWEVERRVLVAAVDAILRPGLAPRRGATLAGVGAK